MYLHQLTNQLSFHIAGVDFPQQEVQLVFNENDTELCGCITVTDDPIFEDDEFFNVNLACAVPGVIFGMMQTATIFILDDDGKFEDTYW